MARGRQRRVTDEFWHRDTRTHACTHQARAHTHTHTHRRTHVHTHTQLRITDEFFLQGDLERSRGMPVTPICDRLR